MGFRVMTDAWRDYEVDVGSTIDASFTSFPKSLDNASAPCWTLKQTESESYQQFSSFLSTTKYIGHYYYYHAIRIRRMIELPKIQRPGGAKKRAAAAAAAVEERVSLIGGDGAPTPEPSQRNDNSKKKEKGWTWTRLMRYLSLTCLSAGVTFLILGKESRSLHWEEYHYLLEPEAKEQRCYVSIILECDLGWNVEVSTLNLCDSAQQLTQIV
jgi:hypothetical protein